MIPRPMTAAKFEHSSANYPYIASPKIDGIRAIWYGGKFYSRSGKLLPNRYLQSVGADLLKEIPYPDVFVDGEIVVGDLVHPRSMAKSMAITSPDGEPDFTYLTFDYCRLGTEHIPYTDRLVNLQLVDIQHFRVKRLQSTIIEDRTMLEITLQTYLDFGFEGMMLRKPESPYKHGRSTLNQGYLLKMKVLEDAEATIIGTYEEMANDNEDEQNAFGLTGRSTHKENLRGKNRLGGFICQSAKFSESFRVGTGFTAVDREQYWYARESLIGKTITFKYQPHGTQVRPRNPSFKGFRPNGI